MDVGLVGAGILSGVLGAHLVTVLHERFSASTWTDSLVGALGGGICGQIVVAASAAWDATAAGLVVGRIAAVVLVALLGGATLLAIVGLIRSRKPDAERAPRSRRDRRTSESDRRKGDRRLSSHDEPQG